MTTTGSTSCLGIQPCSTTFGKHLRPHSYMPLFDHFQTRGITRNEDVYPDPETFNPDRFMNPSKPEILQHVDSVFGFGRRVCPAKAFAENNLWRVIANTIATMDVRKALDENGDLITPTREFESGAIRYEEAPGVESSFCLMICLRLDIPNHSSAQSPTVPSAHDSSLQMRVRLLFKPLHPVRAIVYISGAGDNQRKLRSRSLVCTHYLLVCMSPYSRTKLADRS